MYHKKYINRNWKLDLYDESKSYLDNLCQQLIKELTVIQLKRKLSSNVDINQSLSQMTVINKDIVNSILKLMTVRRSQNMILFTNIDDPDLLTNDINVLKRIVRKLESEESIDIKFKNDHVSKTAFSILDALSADDSISTLNLLPNHLILTDTNEIFNTKTHQYEDSDLYKDYDFIYRSNWHFFTKEMIDKFDDNTTIQFNLSTEIVDRIFNGWSLKSEDISDVDVIKKIQLMQIHIAAIQGDSRGKYVELLGSGGNGKSTLMDSIAALIGHENSLPLNLSDIDNDDKIGLIKSNTRLILGHEIATDYKFNHRTTPRYKQLAMSDPIMISEKYMQPRTVTFMGLGIQACNTLMTFAENNESIFDRRFPIQMTSINFRNNEDLKLNVLDYMKDSFFRSVYATYLFVNCGDFDQFMITDLDKESINELTSKGDSLMLFVEEEILPLSKIKHLSINFMFKLYSEWCQSSNIKSLDKTEFFKKIESYMIKLNYNLSSSREKRNFSSKNKSVDEMFSYLSSIIDIKDHQSRYFYKTNDFYTNEDVDIMINKLKNNEITNESIKELSDDEIMILSFIASNNKFEVSLQANQLLGDL